MTETILEQIEAEKRRLRAELEERLARLDAAAGEVSAAFNQLSPEAKTAVGPVPRVLLAGCRSIREALIVLARRNGGRVVVKDAMPVLEQHGFLAGAKKPWSRVYQTMKQRPDQFKRLPNGVFELKGSALRFEPMAARAARKKAS